MCFPVGIGASASARLKSGELMMVRSRLCVLPGRYLALTGSDVMCFPVGFGVLPGRKCDAQTPMCTSHDALSGVLPGRSAQSQRFDSSVLPGRKRRRGRTLSCVLPGRICFQKAASEAFQHRAKEILRYRCVSRYPFVCFHVGLRVLSRRVRRAFRYGNVCFPVAYIRKQEIMRSRDKRIAGEGPVGPAEKTSSYSYSKRN